MFPPEFYLFPALLPFLSLLRSIRDAVPSAALLAVDTADSLLEWPATAHAAGAAATAALRLSASKLVAVGGSLFIPRAVSAAPSPSAAGHLFPRAALPSVFLALPVCGAGGGASGGASLAALAGAAFDELDGQGRGALPLSAFIDPPAHAPIAWALAGTHTPLAVAPLRDIAPLATPAAVWSALAASAGRLSAEAPHAPPPVVSRTVFCALFRPLHALDFISSRGETAAVLLGAAHVGAARARALLAPFSLRKWGAEWDAARMAAPLASDAALEAAADAFAAAAAAEGVAADAAAAAVTAAAKSHALAANEVNAPCVIHYRARAHSH